MKRALAPLALTLLLAAPAASAADSFRFALGGHAAYSKTRDVEDGIFSGGVQARLRLFGFIGIEGLASYRHDDFDAAGQRVLRLEYVPVQVSAQLYILQIGPIQPYVLGGGGYYYVRSTPYLNGVEGETVTDNTTGAHVGAGVDLMVTKKIALTGDVRYVFLGVDSVKALQDRYQQDSKADYWTANLGLNFYF